MSFNNLSIFALVSVAVLFVIYRQFVSRPAGSSRRAMLVPLGLFVLGAASIPHVPGINLVDLATIGVGLAVGLVLGVIRGSATRIWRDEQGMAWQRGSVALAVLWVVSVAARLGLGFAGSSLGVSQATNLAEIPIFFGVTLLAQNVFVLVRLHRGWRDAFGGVAV